MRSKNVSLVLSQFTRGPVQNFCKKHKAAVKKSAAFKTIGKLEPSGVFRFLDENKSSIEDALFNDPAKTAATFFKAVEETTLDKEDKVQDEALENLWKDLRLWVDAEAAIYVIAVGTLANAPQYVKDPVAPN